MSMEFTNRLKKEMSEGVVRAVLEHAGYRVTDNGIEKQFADINRFTKDELAEMSLPTSFWKQPDFVVWNKNLTNATLVEVKFRTDWCPDLLTKLRDQLSIFESMVLVVFYANAPNPKNLEDSASRHLRCCRLRFMDGKFEAELNIENTSQCEWIDVDKIKLTEGCWWRMLPLQSIFKQHKANVNKNELWSAVNAVCRAYDGTVSPKDADIRRKGRGQTSWCSQAHVLHDEKDCA